MALTEPHHAIARCAPIGGADAGLATPSFHLLRRRHGIGIVVVLRLVMCVIGLDLTHASGSPLSVKSIQDER